ncbi:uncharacterized protein LOC130713008 [Lotus japonicus]|uniref:uncharacterized protein LOC130713008 n=1 Tax=Lotus japonicus TaxID=34305 RepID=UPI002584C514|nr:uncharacterized protein LOC130713008 [Lotus japonicus]
MQQIERNQLSSDDLAAYTADQIRKQTSTGPTFNPNHDNNLNLNKNGSSEDLESPAESDEENGNVKRKFPKFKARDDDFVIKFEVGQIFTNVDLFRNVVRNYALQNKKDLVFDKNDTKRIVIKCTEKCPFYLRASKYVQNNYFQIVTFKDEHTCYLSNRNRQARPSFLAKKFVHLLRHTPHMKLKALAEEARHRWSVRLSRYQVSRARVKAIAMIEGATLEQYKHLRSYGEELRRSDPGTIVKIKTMVDAGVVVFERIYVCLAACKRAFATTCRPLIGLDGCFLKGVYGGQLLTAVGKDGNNQMYHIAYAVVEAETKDSWEWFVDLLLADLDSIQSKRWCFISDQQKGLVPTLAAMDENVDHRFCVKHLYGNWRKKYPGQEMKGALWSAARANTMSHWEKTMDKLKELNEEAWNDMKQIPIKQWSRAGYSTYPKCDLQVNNMCEAFNRAILEYRDKPIINMLEGSSILPTGL